MADQKPTSPDSQGTRPGEQKALTRQEYDRLVRQIADRVWEMWREELRRSQERFRSRSGR